jgi:branched-chain amino acid transport system substrate-binding protein
MKLRRKHSKLALAVMVMAAILAMMLIAGCGSETTSTTAASETTAQPTTTAPSATTVSSQPSTDTTAGGEAKTLKVGMLCDFGLGPHADWKKVMEAIIPSVNASGGINVGGQQYLIDLIMYDTKIVTGGSPETAQSAVQKLIDQDKVDFILDADSVDAWIPITEAAGKLVVFAGGSPGAIKPEYKMVFQASYLQLMPAQVWGWMTEKYPDVKAIAGAHPDSLQGQSEAARIADLCGVFGQQVVEEVSFPANTQDFSAIATKLISKNPDGFSTAGGGPVVDAFLQKALREAGWEGKIIYNVMQNVQKMKKQIDPKYMENMLTAVDTCIPGSPTLTPTQKEYIDIYVNAYGEYDYPANLDGCTWYLLRAALEQSGSIDPKVVAEYMSKGMEYDGPNGHAKLVSRPDRGVTRAVDSLYQGTVGLVRNGEVAEQTTYTLDEAIALNAKAFGW